MPTQQPLINLALREGQRFESFYAGTHNRLLLKEIQASLQRPGHQQLVIWGTAGAGKSHLLQASCQHAHEQGLRTIYLPLTQLQQHGTAVLEGTSRFQLVCMDDIQTVLGQHAWELSLFNLINLAREQQQLLLFSSNENPRHLQTSLPDLHSRLVWGTSLQLHPLNDRDMTKALQFRAAQRGITLDNAVIEYIYKRYPRDFTTLIGILDKLDKESLSSKRKITIPLVKQALGACRT